MAARSGATSNAPPVSKCFTNEPSDARRSIWTHLEGVLPKLRERGRLARRPGSQRVATDVPESERTPLEVLRTDTATFRSLIESRRTRREDWFDHRAGRIEINNVPLPARERARAQRK